MRAEFTRKTKAQAFERCAGHCEACGLKLWTGRIHYDHRDPDWMSSNNSLENCQVLCRPCHSIKTRKDQADIAKVRRVRDRHIGAMRARRGFRGWRKFNGTAVWRTTNDPS